MSKTISPSTQNRILIWRSEVASALDDAASSAASSTGSNGLTPSLSDTQQTHSSADNSHGRGAISRSRRFIRRIARRVSGGRYGSGIDESDLEREPPIRTAMYRAPPPPPPPAQQTQTPTQPQQSDGLSPPSNVQEFVAGAADRDQVEEVVGLGEDSSDGAGGVPGRGLKEKQERLQRAARLLHQQHGGD